jgi:hypothetical protein
LLFAQPTKSSIFQLKLDKSLSNLNVNSHFDTSFQFCFELNFQFNVDQFLSKTRENSLSFHSATFILNTFFEFSIFVTAQVIFEVNTKYSL